MHKIVQIYKLFPLTHIDKLKVGIVMHQLVQIYNRLWPLIHVRILFMLVSTNGWNACHLWEMTPAGASVSH